MAEEVKQEIVEETQTVEDAKKELSADERLEEIIKKREARLAEKLTKEWESKLQAKEAEKEKAMQMAKLTEQEKFELERKEFAQKEARFNALQKLSEEKLNSKFVEMVADTDPAKIEEKIKALKEVIAEQVASQVDSALKASPKSPLSTNSQPQPQISDEEAKLRRVMGLTEKK